MQITPVPFWLMIVSTATAVLPVWRSPMISSRWPRPMGIRASMALRPVCMGSWTLRRWTMGGAIFSRGIVDRRLDDGPLPSMGMPRGLTTRPIRAGPAGMDMILPVRLTVSPSLIFVNSPRRMIPTLSSSRLKARPMTSWGSSSSSPAMAFSRPWARAMPSPTLMMVPISETSTWASKPSIWPRMMREISSARMSMHSSELMGVSCRKGGDQAESSCVFRRRSLPWRVAS